MLISAMVGLDMRSTMDMDASIKGFNLEQDELIEVLNEIISVTIDDGVSFHVVSLKDIRPDDDYTGYRVLINSKFDGIKVPLKLDITTGDVITPKEMHYSFKLMFEDRTINILAYNLETVISEKFETIITRATDNTRARDFYDLYILFKFQSNNFNLELLKQAIENKFKDRETFENLKTVVAIFNKIKTSERLQKLWNVYTKNYSYAEDITFNNVIDTLEIIVNIFN